jgi:alpha,alpha-trehalase
MSIDSRETSTTTKDQSERVERIDEFPSLKCHSKIYCESQLMEYIQKSRIFSDSKTFVDMPTKRPAFQILSEFKANILGKNITHEDLKKFILKNFDPPGTELRVLLPEDWKEQPRFLEKISDKQLLVFSRIIHEKWRSLLRTFDSGYLGKGCTASSFKLPAPFIIPGGRFREFYYWDTFWILEGLYVSEMCQTARNIIDNMLALVSKFGFIPNGSRIYYLNRSQPPLLASMISRYIANCQVNLLEFLHTALPILEREYHFWMKKRSINYKGHTLNLYQANCDSPRPESFIEDELMFQQSNNSTHFYKSVASAAESGWDFSSRWFEDFKTMPTIRTSHIIPVDLNSLMYEYEMTMANLYSTFLVDDEGAEYFRSQANKRKIALQAVFWNGSIWLDVDFMKEAFCTSNSSLYVSSLAPLWHKAYLNSSEIDIRKLLLQFNPYINDFPGGVPVSLVASGQQWDFPNVWAPFQQRMIAMYLDLFKSHKNQKYYETALALAQKYVSSVFCGYQKYGISDKNNFRTSF